jgi:hypothetical protein
MVTNCWSQNPANRPSFRAVLGINDLLFVMFAEKTFRLIYYYIENNIKDAL